MTRLIGKKVPARGIRGENEHNVLFETRKMNFNDSGLNDVKVHNNFGTVSEVLCAVSCVCINPLNETCLWELHRCVLSNIYININMHSSRIT